MGFWHTGYAEFHEPTGLQDHVWAPPPPVRYVCQHCAANFGDLEGLRRHRFEQHPIRQPALLVRGRPVGTLALRVHSSLFPGDVVVEDATVCQVNGKSVPLAGLGEQLSAMRQTYVHVELSNQGATTRCALDFCVADEEHLAGIEAAFLRLARDRELNIEAIARFNGDCRAFPSAMSYCDGISHYLYGVMAKERAADSGLQHEHYLERFHRSSEELSGFDRSLARSVRALVAFHFNQFEDAEFLAPKGALRQVAGAFSGLLKGSSWRLDEALSAAPGSAVEDLLTDQDTLQILLDASHDLVGLKERSEVLLMNLRRSPAGGYDNMKRTLLACEALAARIELSANAEARRLARTQAGNPDADAWATAMLERLSTP